MYHRPLDTLLVTWGVALMLQQLARDVFGAPDVDVPRPGVAVRQRRGPRRSPSPTDRLFILVLSIAGVRRAAPPACKLTPLGRRIRADVQNRDLAESVRHLHRGPRTGSRSSSAPAWRASPGSR